MYLLQLEVTLLRGETRLRATSTVTTYLSSQLYTCTAKWRGLHQLNILNNRFFLRNITTTPPPPPIPNFPRLHLTIWERASYNAGRFGAAFEHDGEVVDMGAQVLTVADPSHHNAGAGGTFRPCTLQHNSSTTAVLKACRLVRQCNVYAS